jgi:hypothetical protein
MHTIFIFVLMIIYIYIIIKTMNEIDTKRLHMACQGKDNRKGGYNVPDLKLFCKNIYTSVNCTKMNREELLKILCKKSQNLDEKNSKNPKKTSPKIDIKVNPKKTNPTDENDAKKMRMACQGKDSRKGGYNVPDLKLLCKTMHPSVNCTKMNREELLKILCKKSQNVSKTKIKSSTKPTEIKASPKPTEIKSSPKPEIKSSPKPTEIKSSPKKPSPKPTDGKRKSEDPDMTSLEKHITSTKNYLIPLSSLMCANINIDHSPKCSNFGETIARSVIRVASERIFTEPEQSIMELPVNSIDSYRRRGERGQSVGKFGMGFFSILHWLIDEPKRALVIRSVYQVGDMKEGYIVQIKHGKSGFMVNFSDFYITDRPSGTEITVLYHGRKFSPSTFLKMENYIQNLKYVPDVKIIIAKHHSLKRGEDKTEVPPTIQIIGNKTSTDQIIIKFSDDGLSVIDYAEGLPFITLMRSLLVPSSSTKTIQQSMASFTNYIDNTRIDSGFIVSQLIITVNDIIVHKTKTKTRYAGEKYDYIMTLPPNTLLPVSRDDIIITEDSIESTLVESRLWKLIEESIEKYNDVVVILDLIDTYVKNTNQPEMNKMHTRLIDRVNQLSDEIIYLPTLPTVFLILSDRLKKMKIKVSTHPRPDLYKLENQLKNIFKTELRSDIFQMVSVLVLPGIGENFTNGGLTSIMFVDALYTEKNPKWVESIIATSPVDIYLKNTRQIDHVAKIDKIVEDTIYMMYQLHQTGKLSDSKDHWDNASQLQLAKNAIKTLVNAQSGIFGNFDSNVGVNHIKSYYLNHIALLDLPDFVELTNYLTRQISTIKLDFVYGMKPVVALRELPLESIRIPSHPKYPVLTGTSFPKKVMEEASYFGELFIKEHQETIYALYKKLIMYTISLFPLSPLGCCYYIGTLQGILPHHILRFELDLYRLPPSYITKLANQSIDETELICVFYIINALLNSGIYFEKIHTSFIFNEIRSRSTPSQLYNMMKNCFTHNIGRTDILDRIVIPVIESCIVYTRINNSTIKPIGYNTSSENKLYKFTAKLLIDYVFNYSVGNEWLDEIVDFSEKRKLSDPNKLQIIEIAVNEGTTKEYMKAVMTELVQNSVDIIRQSDNKDSKISIRIGSEFISVSDTIGIEYNNKAAFLALMIPFFSTKSTKDPNVVGEMGTGFFNVYRRPWCKKVIIISRRDGHLTYIKATPIVDKTDRVIDIKYTLQQSRTTQPNGTDVSVMLSNKIMDRLVHELASATEFAGTTLGLIDIPIEVNSQSINVKKILIYSSEMGSAYITTTPSVESYVLTNGIPFLPLHMFVKQFMVPECFANLLASRLVINFNKNVYIPVQSRTNIILIPPHTNSGMGQFLSDAMYSALCKLYSLEELSNPGNLITHSYSRAHISQLGLPETRDTLREAVCRFAAPLSNYTPFNSEILPTFEGIEFKDCRSLSQFINVIIRLKQKAQYNIPLHSIDESLMLSAIRKWFSNKDDKITPPDIIVVDDKKGTPSTKGTKETKTKETKTNGIDENPIVSATPAKLLSKFASAYWEICRKLVQNLRKDPPQVFYGPDLQYAGVYYIGDHRIVLKSHSEPVENNFETFIKSKSVEIITTNPVLNGLISTRLPTTVLIHELYHAIRGDGHMGSHHPHHTLKLIDGTSITGSFDEVAVGLYSKAIENGLFNLLFM